LDFSSNINPLGPSDRVLGCLDKKKIEHYPPAYSPLLRKKIAGYLNVNVENITVGNGSAELIKDFCSTFLSREKSAVVLEPTFAEYSRFAKIYGKNVTHILPNTEFCFTNEDVLKTLNTDNGLIFICRPNNPTGHSIPENDLDTIIEHAKKDNILVFLDEAFIEFSNIKSYTDRVNEFKNLFVLRSFTKFYAIPGLRAGYGVGSKEIISKLENQRVPWNVNTIAQDAAILSLSDKDYQLKTKNLISSEKEFLKKGIEELGIKVYDSKVNFLLLRHCWKSKNLKKRLLMEGLLIRDCSTFKGLDERYVRVSVRTRDDNKKLINSLDKALKEGIDKGENCYYYPCHFKGQDCTFCFCLFYPCMDKILGKMITGRHENKIWTCKNCNKIHTPRIVEALVEELKGEVVQGLDEEGKAKLWKFFKQQI